MGKIEKDTAVLEEVQGNIGERDLSECLKTLDTDVHKQLLDLNKVRLNKLQRYLKDYEEGRVYDWSVQKKKLHGKKSISIDNTLNITSDLDKSRQELIQDLQLLRII